MSRTVRWCQRNIPFLCEEGNKSVPFHSATLSICLSAHPLLKSKRITHRKKKGCIDSMRDSILIATVAVLFFSIRVAAQAPRPSAPAPGFHLLETTIEDIQAALQAKRITCREL